MVVTGQGGSSGSIPLGKRVDDFCTGPKTPADRPFSPESVSTSRLQHLCVLVVV